MTDAKKPRELHLVGQENFTIFASLDSAEQAQELVSSIRRSNQPCYLHVIEKSAYDKLLVRIERTKSAAYHALLEMSAWLGIPEHKRKAQIEYLMKNVNYCADIDISKRDNEAKNE